MRILVCISCVPDTTSKINFKDNDRIFDEQGVQVVINPNDEFGLTRAIWFKEKIEKNPGIYDQLRWIHFNPKQPEFAPNGPVDMVLTFRNVHNWAKAGSAEAMFAGFAKALNPGGVLGVVEHRAKVGTPLDKQIKSGYMTEDYVRF